MKEVLFIAAGTRGAKRIGNLFQPYIPIRDQLCVQHVMESAINATTIDKIYIWGDPPTLKTILHTTLSKAARNNIEVIIAQEKNNFVSSFLFTYLLFLSHRLGQSVADDVLAGDEPGPLQWDLLREFGQDEAIANLSVNLILSDTPLIKPYEIDTMITHKNPNADLIFGRTVKHSMDRVMSGIPESFRYDLAVKNYYNYILKEQSVDLIVNSFMAGKPLRIPGYVWNFAGHLFHNRTIIEGGRFNLKKIKNNVIFFKSIFSKNHLADVERSGSSKLNYYQKLKVFSFLVRSYFAIINNNKKAQKKFRDLSVLEEKIKSLTNCTIEYQISDCFGPALDIDTEYEIEYIDRFFESLSRGMNPT
ncbi:MAG: hypothetical protein H7839_20140 [Magnetococcus sp. YQC-5]